MNPYDVLDVAFDAPAKEIKAAYRRLSKQFHPDTEFGSQEAFEQIKLAYDVLINPERRKRYDLTGRVDESVVTEDRVREMIANAVRGIINGPRGGIMDDPVWSDIRNKAIKSLKEGQRQIQTNMHETQRKLERAERLIERFKSKTDQDPVGDALRSEREKLKGEMHQHEDAMEMSQAVEEVFNKYDYEVGPGPEGQFSPGPPSRRGGFILPGSSFTASRG